MQDRLPASTVNVEVEHQPADMVNVEVEHQSARTVNVENEHQPGDSCHHQIPNDSQSH